MADLNRAQTGPSSLPAKSFIGRRTGTGPPSTNPDPGANLRTVAGSVRALVRCLSECAQKRDRKSVYATPIAVRIR